MSVTVGGRELRLVGKVMFHNSGKWHQNYGHESNGEVFRINSIVLRGQIFYVLTTPKWSETYESLEEAVAGIDQYEREEEQ
jgi:hypothetical protein